MVKIKVILKSFHVVLLEVPGTSALPLFQVSPVHHTLSFLLIRVYSGVLVRYVVSLLQDWNGCNVFVAVFV